VPETEEVVMLVADTGTETAGFKDGLGKDDFRVFDAVLLQCGIEVLDGQLLYARLYIIIYLNSATNCVIRY
jgi:hypothetical protein